MKEHPHEQDLVPTEKISHSAPLHHVQCQLDYMEQQKGQRAAINRKANQWTKHIFCFHF
jgi:hypothetical protein